VLSLKLKLAFPLASVVALPLPGLADPLTLKLIGFPAAPCPPGLISVAVTVTVVPACTELDDADRLRVHEAALTVPASTDKATMTAATTAAAARPP